MPLCFDTTGEIPAIPIADKKPALHISSLSLPDIQEVANAAQAVQRYPDGHGNGIVILEFVNGFLSTVKVQLCRYVLSTLEKPDKPPAQEKESRRSRRKKKPLVN